MLKLQQYKQEAGMCKRNACELCEQYKHKAVIVVQFRFRTLFEIF